MNKQAVLNGRMGIGLALFLGRSLSSNAADRLAGWVGMMVARRKSSALVRAIYANHWVLNKGNVSMDELDKTVRQTLHQAGQCLYDFYHTLNHPQEILERITFTPDVNHLIQDSLLRGSGVMIVTPHTSNFDLAGQALALRGLPIQTLSYPRPPAGYQWQNKLRSKYGMEVTPASLSSIKRAKERLKNGGVVITGLDRPTIDTKYSPLFFNRPALVPVTHVSLAMQTNVPVVVMACHTNPDGSYLLQCSEKIWMQSSLDKSNATIKNAEKVLAVAETFILQDPTQWLMFYPVWPEALEEVPNA